MVFKVNVEPLAACCTGFRHCDGNELPSDALAARSPRDDGVQDECVDAAVPRDIYEADEIFLLAGADPAKAVPLELASPVVFKHRMPKGFSARRMAVT